MVIDLEYIRKSIFQKKQEIEENELLFDYCDPEDFDIINARISLLRQELSSLIRKAKELSNLNQKEGLVP